MLHAQVKPAPTAGLGLQDVALGIALALNHSPYDSLYVAFALAVGADKLLVADRRFSAAIRHPNPMLRACRCR